MHKQPLFVSLASLQEGHSMWRDTAQEFLDVPILMFPLLAPLSRPMVEHLVLLECQPYRRAVRSSWPKREEVWQRVVERVARARTDVCEYMDVFVQDDIKRATEESKERAFPDDTWILDQLAAYTPDNIKMTPKALEGWQARNILRREQARGLWRLDDVAALLIMRIVNVTHQKAWLPPEIPEDEPRWWAFGKDAPDGPVQVVPIPLQGAESNAPLLLWTPRIGASWDGQWQRHHGISVRWSRLLACTNEVAVWHTMYAQEIHATTLRAAQVSSAEFQHSEDGTLTTRPTVQEVMRASVQQLMKQVEHALLREAGNLILEEQALMVSKEE